MKEQRDLILLRFERRTQHQLGAIEAHGKRQGDTEHVDPSRTHLNEFLVGDENLRDLANERIVELQKINAERKRQSLKKGRRTGQLRDLNAALDAAGYDPSLLAEVVGSPWDAKNVHPFTEGMLSISHDWFLGDDGRISDERVGEFRDFAKGYLAKEFGREVIYARLDLDEKTPHISFVVAPQHEEKRTKRVMLSHHSHRLFSMYEPEVPFIVGDEPDPKQAKRSYEFFQDRIAAYGGKCGLSLSRGERRASREREQRLKGEMVVQRHNVSPSRGRELALLLAAEAEECRVRAERDAEIAADELVVARSNRSDAEADRELARTEQLASSDILKAANARAQAMTVGVDAVMTEQLIYSEPSGEKQEGLTWGPAAPEEQEKRSWLKDTIQPAKDWLIGIAKRMMGVRQREEEAERMEADVRRRAAVLHRAEERAGRSGDKALAAVAGEAKAAWDEEDFPGAWAVRPAKDQTEVRNRLDLQTNRNLRDAWLATVDAVQITSDAGGDLQAEFKRGESILKLAAAERGFYLISGRHHPETATDANRATLHTDEDNKPIQVIRRDKTKVRTRG